MTAEMYIGVDVGGGGIRIQARVDGRPHEANDPGPVPRSAGQIDVDKLGVRIGRLVSDLGHVAPAVRVARVVVGLTGMPGLLEHPQELAAVIHRTVPAESVIIASDSLTTHVGALEGRPGAVVAAGTGVIVLATDHATVWNHVDGWGFLLGDDGGGAWIGSHGLRAALKSLDGRPGGSKHLLNELRLRFGDAEAAMAQIYGTTSPAHELAAFAPSVARAAHAGDPVALDIWHRAGAALAESVHAASHGVADEYSWGGKLFDAGDILFTPFQETLRRLAPGARLTPPAGQAADGALILAQRGIADRQPALATYAQEFPGVGHSADS